MVGVNVNIGPVAQIERGNRDGRRIIVIVVAARGIGRHVLEKLIARALLAGASLDDGRFRRVTGLRVVGCRGADDPGQLSSNVGDKTGQRPGSFGDVQDGFVLEGIAAHHVHVNVGPQPGSDIGMAAEIRHGALHLRSPHEAQGAFRTRQRAAVDQARQHARRLQNGYAAATVVIGPGPLMIQMAAVNDFAALPVRSRNDSAYHRPVPRADFSFHFGAEDDLLARPQARPQGRPPSPVKS